jgi:hypothetical protein
MSLLYWCSKYCSFGILRCVAVVRYRLFDWPLCLHQVWAQYNRASLSSPSSVSTVLSRVPIFTYKCEHSTIERPHPLLLGGFLLWFRIPNNLKDGNVTAQISAQKTRPCTNTPTSLSPIFVSHLHCQLYKRFVEVYKLQRNRWPTDKFGAEWRFYENENKGGNMKNDKCKTNLLVRKNEIELVRSLH